MDSVHVHLFLNHMPFAGILIGISLMLHSFLKNNQTTYKISLIVIIISAFIIIPVYFSGEASEEVIEAFPDIEEKLIEDHEKAATITLASTIILGLIATVAFFKKQNAVSIKFAIIIIFVGLVSLISIVYTSSLGGQIRHSEIRNKTIFQNENIKDGNSSDEFNNDED